MHADRRRRGSALSLSIIVSVVVSGLISAMAWVAGVQTQSTAAMAKLDQAFYAAESGAQRVAWFCKKNRIHDITPPLTGSINGYSYSTRWTSGTASSLQLSSTGASGTASYLLSMQVAPPSPAVPMFASVGDFDNKNIIVTGDLAVQGSYTNGGSGQVNGNLTYGASASHTQDVSGTVGQGAFTPVDWSALDASLKPAAVTKNPGDVLDFTALPGDNKVIYVDGDIADPTIIGSGTLYVNGSVSFSHNATVGEIGSSVNIVARGDIHFNKKAAVIGSLYAAGNLDRAQLDINGVVYVAGIAKSNSGQCTWTYAAPPWFDPRTAGGSGSPVMTVSSFTGPQP